MAQNIVRTNHAPDVFKYLNGLIKVYKPPDVHHREVRSTILQRLCEDLNELEPRPLAKRLALLSSNLSNLCDKNPDSQNFSTIAFRPPNDEIDKICECSNLPQSGNTNTDRNEDKLVWVPNLADHPLVVGPRYLPSELRLAFCSPILGIRSSGVMLALLGDHNQKYLKRFNRARFVSTYHLAGRLGYGTISNFPDGKIFDKTSYKYVRNARMDGVLSHIRSSQQTRLFKLSSIPVDSQAAYETAKMWPARPSAMANWPLIFNLRCIHLKVPDFVVEVTIVNEHQQFLADLIGEIGIMLKTTAFCTLIRRVKYGPFTIDDKCLIEKDWYLQPIINNIHAHNELDLESILKENRTLQPLTKSFKATQEKKLSEVRE